MTEQGYIYILINPSIQGLVKVGKTTRNPEERARELSQATGVPSPFCLAFSLPFADCDSAERYFHTLLEMGGFRVAENREFFKVSLNEAVKLLLEVQQRLASIQADAEVSAHSDDSPAATELGEDLCDKAMDLFLGEGDVIEDRDQAIELLEKAVALDYQPAYVRLAKIYSDFRNPPDIKTALTILRDGIAHGHDGCWIHMAEVFRKENNIVNFNKCWKNFFRSPTFVDGNDDEGKSRTDQIRQYLSTIRAHGIPLDEGLRAILLPFRNEVIADMKKLVEECTHSSSELNRETLTKTAREFLQFASDAFLAPAHPDGESQPDPHA